MEITENQLYEAFGLDQPETTPPESETGMQEFDEETEAEENTGGAARLNETEENTLPAEQTKEERRRNAAKRREAERQAAIDAAVKEAVKAERERSLQAQKDFFKKAALRNSLTGEEITTMEDFDRWKADFDAAKLAHDLEHGTLTPEGLNAAIEANPVVQAAKQIVDGQTATAQQQADNDARARMQADIAEISKIDPSIKDVSDFAKMPNYKEFYDKVMAGYSFSDAYYVVNREKIAQQQTEAAQQQAQLNARGKNHLTGTAAQRGKGMMSVPPDVLKNYRIFNPNASDEEILAHYNKNHKGR